MNSGLPRHLFALMVRVVIAALVLLVWWYAAKSQDPARSDATADWVLAKAISTGLSPFEDVRSLASKLQVPYRSVLDTTESIVAYRTPGGLLFLYPLLLFDWSWAHIVINVVSVLCFLWMLLVQVPRYCGVPVERLLLPLALASVSSPFIETTFWGAVSAIVAAFTIAAALKAGRRSAGIPLAAATVLKLYPGLLFIVFLVKRHRAWLVGAVAVVAGTALGALAFDLSVVESIRLLIQGSAVWLTSDANLSVPAMLTGPTAPSWIFPFAVLAGIAFVGMYSRRRPLTQSLAVAIAVSLVVSPVSWGSYEIVLIPSVLWLWTRYDYWFGRYTAFAWLIFQAVVSTLAKYGALDQVRIGLFCSTLLVAVAIAIAPARLWESPAPARSLQLTS